MWITPPPRGGGGVTLNNPSIVSAGHAHTLAISDGKLWAWGWNGYGQLGDGTTTQRNAPVRIGTATNWISVSAGVYHSLALNDKGEIWSWGNNYYGQLGDGTAANTNRTTPIKVGNQSNWVSIQAGSIFDIGYDSWSFSMALNSLGEIWSWGGNNVGQLGIGTTTNKTTPVKVGTKTDWINISAGYGTAYGINTSGELWGWGDNTQGQLGDGTTTQRNSPVQIGTKSNWVSVCSGRGTWAMAINDIGELYAWGWNIDGRFGDGTTTNSTSPKKIGTKNNWVSISVSGAHTMALNNLGELWAWGNNSYGQLGDATVTRRTTPVKIGTQTDWAITSAGGIHSSAINSDGQLYTWGYNYYGQLGLGDTTNRYAPQLVSGLTLGYTTAAPNSIDGLFIVSAPSKTRVFPGETYTFTVTRHDGDTSDVGLKLFDPSISIQKGKVELTSTNGNVLTYTVTNITQSITPDDFFTYNVELPQNGSGYTISTAMTSSFGSLFVFTITTTNGHTMPMVRFTSPNGKLSYTSIDMNTLTVTISNVTGNITATDFTISVSRVA